MAKTFEQTQKGYSLHMIFSAMIVYQIYTLKHSQEKEGTTLMPGAHGENFAEQSASRAILLSKMPTVCAITLCWSPVTLCFIAIFRVK